MNHESGDVAEEQETRESSEELEDNPEMAPTDEAGEADMEEDQQATEARSETSEETEDESQDKPEEDKLGEQTSPEDKPGEGKGGAVRVPPAAPSISETEENWRPTRADWNARLNHHACMMKLMGRCLNRSIDYWIGLK